MLGLIGIAVKFKLFMVWSRPAALFRLQCQIALFSLATVVAGLDDTVGWWRGPFFTVCQV